MAVAYTTISDVIVPSVFAPYLDEERTKVNRLVQSGALVNDPFLAAFLAGGGNSVNVPSWKNTDTDGENVDSDDATDTTPTNLNKMETSEQVAIRINRNGIWGSADLVATLAGDDPMGAAARMVAGFQVQKRQQAMISVLKGLLNATGPLAAGVQTYGTTIDADHVIDAQAPFADEQAIMGSTLVMHSKVWRDLQKAELIDFEPTSTQNIGFGTYLGYTLAVDDDVEVVSGTPDTYYTYVLGAGSFGTADGRPRVPVEVEREATYAEGGGIERLIVRDQYVMHPYGCSYTPTGGLPNNPTNAALATVADWSLVFPRKKVKINAFITQ